jgi:hypothetical protein
MLLMGFNIFVGNLRGCQNEVYTALTGGVTAE